MDQLTLSPEVDVRDVRVTFSVGDRTVRSHVGSRREAPLLVSLSALERTLESAGPARLLVCRCSDSACDEAPAVTIGHSDEEVVWTVALGAGDLAYRFDKAQVRAELHHIRSTIQNALDRSHHAGWRFHPPSDESLFTSPALPNRGWFLRNSLVFLLAVGSVTAGAVAMVGRL